MRIGRGLRHPESFYRHFVWSVTIPCRGRSLADLKPSKVLTFGMSSINVTNKKFLKSWKSLRNFDCLIGRKAAYCSDCHWFGWLG